MGYTFRKAIKQELSEILNLFQLATSYMDQNNIFQWDEIYPNEADLLGDIEKEEMYLLTEKDKIISCIVINEIQGNEYFTATWKYTEGRIAVIHRLCVDPMAQGLGNGKRTLQFAEEQMKIMGYDIIRLDAFSQNPAATHMYESLGYTYAGDIQLRKGLFYLFEKSLVSLKNE